METTAVKKGPRELTLAHWKRTTEADKKKRILSAVLRLVVKYGVHGTTTAGIAAEAGMSEPTLYRTYRNKKDILLATADAAWQMRQADLGSASDPGALKHLRKLAEYHTSSIQTTPAVEIAYHFAVAPPEFGLLERIREQIVSDVQGMANLIEEGKTQGSIRPDVNSQEAAWRLMAAFWSESTARLFHFEDAVLASGISAQNLHSILKEIATEPRG
jgi:TetR/AcrR family transcriptional regulator